jgi:glycogen(starch) synthase
MRIALITFEFPPAVAIGGIGTYAFEAARMLAEAGCDVEVFAAGIPGHEPAEAYGVRVHRLDVANRAILREAVVPVFAERHRVRPFDVMESPEIGAEGAGVATAFPDLAVVVKLHTPTYVVGKVGYEAPTLAESIRFSAGALRRGRLDALKAPRYVADDDLECCFTRKADGVAAPSQAIHDLLAADWQLDESRMDCFAYPFRPDTTLLESSLPSECKTIGFLGRLEARKGVVELARAIPKILRKAPNLRFRFIGPSWPYRQSDMATWIRNYVGPYQAQLDFTGPIGRDQLPEEFHQCDAIILPSRWENFPFACWESMASGRVVIGSAEGGMADVIEPGLSGFLVPPHSPDAIADAILSLVNEPARVTSLGESGRRRVLEHLAPARVLPLQLASYRKAIANSQTHR